MRRTLKPVVSLALGALWLLAALAIGGRFVVEIELYSHFHPPLLLACALATMAALLGGRQVGAVVSLLLAIALGWGTVAYLWPPPALAAQAGPQSIRLLWANLQNWTTDSADLDAVLDDAQADIIVLTELSARHVQAVERARQRWPHQTRFPSGSAFDLLLLSRWPARDMRVHQPLGDQFPVFDGLFCPELAGWNGACFAVVSLHAVRPALPGGAIGIAPTRRDTMLDAAAGAARGRIADGHRLVLLGDLNSTPWSASFRRVLGEGGLTDSATQPAERPRWPLPSWFSTWPGIGLPIDHALLGPDWRVVERRAGPYFRSDHRPLVIELRPAGR